MGKGGWGGFAEESASRRPPSPPPPLPLSPLRCSHPPGHSQVTAWPVYHFPPCPTDSALTMPKRTQPARGSPLTSFLSLSKSPSYSCVVSPSHRCRPPATPTGHHTPKVQAAQRKKKKKKWDGSNSPWERRGAARPCPDSPPPPPPPCVHKTSSMGRQHPAADIASGLASSAHHGAHHAPPFPPLARGRCPPLPQRATATTGRPPCPLLAARNRIPPSPSAAAPPLPRRPTNGPPAASRRRRRRCHRHRRRPSSGGCRCPHPSTPHTRTRRGGGGCGRAALPRRGTRSQPLAQYAPVHAPPPPHPRSAPPGPPPQTDLVPPPRPIKGTQPPCRECGRHRVRPRRR